MYSASAGTGKTYTLAARYIALLMDSLSDRAYRHVLAVTFTNKATAEMKQRILSQLYKMSLLEVQGSKAKIEGFMADVRRFMSHNMSDTVMAAKAKRIYRNILEEYDDMCVSTIDSFLQQLITGMAHMLGIGADFGVELDNDHIIATAVDEVMTEPLAEGEGVVDKRFNVLSDYLEERLDEEKGWDVRRNLIRMTKELMKEAVLKEEGSIVLDPDKIKSYKRSVNWRDNDCLKTMSDLYGQVKDCKQDDEIAGGRNFYSFIDRVGLSLEGKTRVPGDMFRGLGDADYEKLRSEAFPAKIVSGRGSEVQRVLLDLHRLCTEFRPVYLTSTITTQYLNDLAMMSFVKENIDRNLEEANSILLARSAYVLHAALKPGDADFILEKAGIRYHHIMIDEFQDTSTLQWAVFRQLIVEVLSSGGTALIVGDVKQSIYRWRNGDYHIMQTLREAESNCTLSNSGHRGLLDYVNNIPLKKNYRSQPQVVRFNHDLFDFLCREGGYAHAFEAIYSEKEKTGCAVKDQWSLSEHCAKADEQSGYVQVKTYDYKSRVTDPNEAHLKHDNVKKHIIEDMFGDIMTLLGKGVSMSDMMILVCYKREAKEIVDQFSANGLYEKGLRLCSNDSFRLDSSRSVQVVINALKYVVNRDNLAAMYLQMAGVAIDGLNKALLRLPLNEMLEEVIRITLFGADDILRYDDTSYLNSLIDEVGNYVSSYGSNVNDFLLYWDDQLHSKAIPASEAEGVRIMTIHSAKGLEKKYVFIPFCSWPLAKSNAEDILWHEPMSTPNNTNVEKLSLIPTAKKQDIDKTGYGDAYSKEREARKVDSLNLLYVALTRAADQLYVYADVMQKSQSTRKSKSAEPAEPQTVGDLLCTFIQGKELTVGDNSKLTGDKEVDDTPFEHHFSEDEKIDYTFRSSAQAIKFRQSQESLTYMQRGAEGIDKAFGHINAGNLRHDIFAHINTMSDTDRVVNEFYVKGLIATREEADKIFSELEQAWANPKMAEWFGGSWQVLREVSILRSKDDYDLEMAQWRALPEAERGPVPKRELRPDRIMINSEGEAVVLDFKFGKHNHIKYSKQIYEYMELLTQMGYSKASGYLWYGFDAELVKV